MLPSWIIPAGVVVLWFLILGAFLYFGSVKAKGGRR